MEIVGILAPVVIVGYVLWLLTRLTQTVERIDFRLQNLERREHPDVVDARGTPGGGLRGE